jgi:hypothetical protein
MIIEKLPASHSEIFPLTFACPAKYEPPSSRQIILSVIDCYQFSPPETFSGSSTFHLRTTRNKNLINLDRNMHSRFYALQFFLMSLIVSICPIGRKKSVSFDPKSNLLYLRMYFKKFIDGTLVALQPPCLFTSGDNVETLKMHVSKSFSGTWISWSFSVS